jgi:hypothetical protein
MGVLEGRFEIDVQDAQNNFMEIREIPQLRVGGSNTGEYVLVVSSTLRKGLCQDGRGDFVCCGTKAIELRMPQRYVKGLHTFRYRESYRDRLQLGAGICMSRPALAQGRPSRKILN